MLIITLDVDGIETDGIITYDENDGKYYLGSQIEPKYYEVVYHGHGEIQFIGLSENVSIIAISREFPSVESVEPMVPWDYDSEGNLTLTQPVEQTFILDKLIVLTVNENGSVQRRRFTFQNSRLEVRTANVWIGWISAFEGRKTQFTIKTNRRSSTSVRIAGFEIIL